MAHAAVIEADRKAFAEAMNSITAGAARERDGTVEERHERRRLMERVPDKKNDDKNDNGIDW